jgi:hypothetical protein
MKKEKFWRDYYTTLILALILLLQSCVTDPRINRPDVPICINLSQGCYCAHSSGEYEVKDCSNYISSDPDSYEKMEKYVDELEVRLLKCLNFPKKCN